MTTELQETQTFFRNHDIPLSTEWLESCIEWCKNGDGNLPPNYSSKDLHNMVFEQWLLLDLRDVEICSLPRNLSSEKKYTLSGSFCLQVMQVVDISKPKLWQIQRIRNNVAKNTEAEKDFGKRVLQLTLTDGVQEVEAMEFKPIPCLNINMPPGAKIRITGPLVVRNGRLMLKEENVKYLGGSVDEIKVKYAAENVLARALRLEENPNPYPIDERALEITEANTTTQMNNTATTQNYNAPIQNRNQQQNYHSQTRNNITTNQNITRNNQNNSRTQNNRQSYNQEIPPEFEVDDELLRELETDFEDNTNKKDIRSNIGTTKKTNIPNRDRQCSSPDLFEEMEMDDDLLNDHLNQIDVDHIASNVRSNENTTRGFGSDSTRKLGSGFSVSRHSNTSKNIVQDLNISSSSTAKDKENKNNDVITLDDSFEDIDIDLHLDNIDEEMANLPSSTQIRNDFKDRIGSPELKTRKKNPSKSPEIESSSLKLNIKPKTSKKLTQGTLNFGTPKGGFKNVSDTSRSTLQSCQDVHPSEDPFAISRRQHQPIPYVPDFVRTNKKTTDQNNTSSSIGSANTSINLNQKSDILPSETRLLSPKVSPKLAHILTIDKLKKMIPNVSKGKFKIKGKFKKVAEKLQHADDGYHFVIVVEDGTGELPVQIHSDIVTKIAGVGPEELGRLRVLALQQDEEVKSRIVKILQNLHQRCLILDDVLEIQVTRGEKYPVVINIIENS